MVRGVCCFTARLCLATAKQLQSDDMEDCRSWSTLKQTRSTRLSSFGCANRVGAFLVRVCARHSVAGIELGSTFCFEFCFEFPFGETEFETEFKINSIPKYGPSWLRVALPRLGTAKPPHITAMPPEPKTSTSPEGHWTRRPAKRESSYFRSRESLEYGVVLRLWCMSETHTNHTGASDMHTQPYKHHTQACRA
jgi:hypothetical protein